MKKLLLSISFLSLVNLSMTVYAACKDGDGYTCYSYGDYSRAANGDCLEMICEHGCVERDNTFEGRCCSEPKEGTDCRTDVYQDGCLIEKKKTCATNEQCGSDGQCKTCIVVPKESCSVKADTVDKNGCTTVKKIDCANTPETPLCNSKGVCVECIKNEDCPSSNGLQQYCDTQKGVCETCPEPTNTNCLLTKDTVDSKTKCVMVKKIDCADTPETPVCSKKTGQCTTCEVNTDCEGLQYCNASNHQCNTCPVSKNLPRAGQKCTDTCGCADGLECVRTGSSLCGVTGICQAVCHDNSDCGRNEYCAFEKYTGQCEKGAGECRSNKTMGKSFSSKTFGTFYSSGETMTHWSAENWCASHGWRLTDVYNSLSCYYGSRFLNDLDGNDYAHCCKNGKEDCATKNSNMSSMMLKLRESLGKKGCYWTNYSSSCHSYTLGLEANQIWNTPKTGKQYLTRPTNYMHALCQ